MLISKTRLFGGSGGTPFDELPDGIVGIERIVIRYGQFVDGLAITYLLQNGERVSKDYGGAGSEESPEIVLEADEKICAVTVHSGQFVDSLAFITYRMFNLVGMKRYGPYGGPGGVSCTVLSPDIKEFIGRSGLLLDAVGFRGEEPMFVC